MRRARRRMPAPVKTSDEARSLGSLPLTRFWIWWRRRVTSTSSSLSFFCFSDWNAWMSVSTPLRPISMILSFFSSASNSFFSASIDFRSSCKNSSTSSRRSLSSSMRSYNALSQPGGHESSTSRSSDTSSRSKSSSSRSLSSDSASDSASEPPSTSAFCAFFLTRLILRLNIRERRSVYLLFSPSDSINSVWTARSCACSTCTSACFPDSFWRHSSTFRPMSDFSFCFAPSFVRSTVSRFSNSFSSTSSSKSSNWRSSAAFTCPSTATRSRRSAPTRSSNAPVAVFIDANSTLRSCVSRMRRTSRSCRSRSLRSSRPSAPEACTEPP
eukprot:Opistho-2@58605